MTEETRRRATIRGGLDDGAEFWLYNPKPEHIWSVPVSMNTFAENMGHFLRTGTKLTKHVLVGEDEQGRLVYEPRPNE